MRHFGHNASCTDHPATIVDQDNLYLLMQPQQVKRIYRECLSNTGMKVRFYLK